MSAYFVRSSTRKICTFENGREVTLEPYFNGIAPNPPSPFPTLRKVAKVLVPRSQGRGFLDKEVVQLVKDVGKPRTRICAS